MAESARSAELVRWHQGRIFQWRYVETYLLKRISAAVDADKSSRPRISSRVKDERSFVAKAMKVRNDGSLKYSDPMSQIHDLVGIRLVVALAEDIPSVAKIVRGELDVREIAERGQEDPSASPGYQSLHLVGSLSDDDPVLRDYPALAGDVCVEIQIRSALQDAYASFHHDIAFKTDRPVSPGTERQLKVLAAVLDLADQEFSRVRAAAVDPDEAIGSGDASGEWSEEDLADVVRRHVGSTEEDPRPWLSELGSMLTVLGIVDRTELAAVLSGSRSGAALAQHLRIRRPWLSGVQVLDVMLQGVLGERYVDARTADLSVAARASFVEALDQERAMDEQP